MPAPLPCAWMKLQNNVSLVSSAGLRVEGWKLASVTANPGNPGVLWTEVPEARIPGTKLPNTPGPAGVDVGELALQVPPEPVGDRPNGVVASNLMVIDVGLWRLTVKRLISFCTDSEWSPFGSTRQEQQATNVRLGSNAYTLTHMLPVELRPVGRVRVPVFMKLSTESARSRFVTYPTWYESIGAGTGVGIAPGWAKAVIEKTNAAGIEKTTDLRI